MIAAAGWEWGRLNGQAGGNGAGPGGRWRWPLPVRAWLRAGAARARARSGGCGGAGLGGGRLAALRAGPTAWPQAAARSLRWASGWWLLWAAWLALVQRAPSASTSCCRCCAWCGWPTSRPTSAAAPSAAASWRRAISPGKSWEGVWSRHGSACCCWRGLDGWSTAGGGGGQPEPVHPPVHPLGAGPLPRAAGLAGMSVVGDLVESLVKRAAGAKDSSRPAARPWRRARPRRRAAAGVPAGAGLVTL
jgi:phosphatidate cytidylyltransferase